jgi:hypothetical protein
MPDMTYMNAPQDQIVSFGEGQPHAGDYPDATRYRIRRMGGRPLEFAGVELGMAMSFSPEIPYWYEINLYRTSDRTFVLAIRLFFQSEAERDLVSASAHETLAEALDALEAYDAAEDVRLTLDMASEHLSAAELAASALDLRARAKAARSHFGGLVGEFLHQMDFAA